MNGAYGQLTYGQYGLDPVTAALFAAGSGAQATTAAIAAHRAPPSRLELQMAAYKQAAERTSPVLQARMRQQLMGLAALAIGGGIALVAIITAGKAGKKEKKKK
jgi:hypothetical protein